MANGTQELRPLKIAKNLPNLAQSFTERDKIRQQASVTASNLRGASIQQRGQLQTQDIQAQNVQQAKQAQAQSRLKNLTVAFRGVDSPEKFKLAMDIQRAYIPPEGLAQFEEGANRLFPEGYDQERIDQFVNTLGDPQKLINLSKGARLVDPITKETIVGAGGGAEDLSSYSKKNQDGSVRTIKNVTPGSQQAQQLEASGFVKGTQTVGIKPSAEERKERRLVKNVDKLSALATADPNKFHDDHNFRQNDDGSLYIDPVTDAPLRLKPFTTSLGKRGNVVSVKALGEQMNDAGELLELMNIKSVQENLKRADREGMWDQVAGKWSNKIKRWMTESGIAGDSPTATAIARIQRMASEERKRFMGTAVTDNEIRSSLAWMPSAGDSFESIMNKANLMQVEAKQEFIRWLDLFEKDTDMSTFYKAFDIKRFGEQPEPIKRPLSGAAQDFLTKKGL